jgi:hypothetical protein
VIYPVDMVTSTVSLAITPFVNTTLAWSSTPLQANSSAANTLTIIHDDFAPQTTYTLTLSAGQTAVGHWIPASTYTFTTAPSGTVYGVLLSANSADSGPPGSIVTYTVSITNTGNSVDTYALAISGNAWATDLSTDVVTLNAGENTAVLVTVDIPPGAMAGENDTATLTATSQNSSNTSDATDLTTTAEVIYAVTLSPDVTGTGLPGDTVTYTLHLTNTGNVTDTFDLSVSSVWTATLSLPGATLGTGQQTTILISVIVPAGAVAGDSDMATITAVSQGDNTITAAASATTTVGGAPVFQIYLPVVMR